MEPFMRLAAVLIVATLAGIASPALAAPAGGSPKPEGWVQITPAPLRLKGHTYKPTCSAAPGTDPTYSFWYRKGIADGLVVFFNGGGACWSDGTCDKPRLAGSRAMFAGEKAESVFKSELLPGDGPERMGGIFDSTNARNPVRDWSVLFVSYCTGDVHSGSNTAHYRNPETGKPFTIEHRGWDNMQVITEWMRVHVPQPSRLLVSGSSAGAYGAATHYATLRALYPRARSVFLGDSGMGVSTPSFERLRNKNWNYQLPVSVFGPQAQLTPDAEVVARLAAHFPQDRFAQYTRAHDAVQRDFYAEMGAPRGCMVWTMAMTRELARRQRTPNVRSYVARGDGHTILRSPLVYSEQSGGQPFVDWLNQLLNGPMPANQACTNCLTDPASCAPQPAATGAKRQG
jgi:hypothetical protein